MVIHISDPVPGYKVGNSYGPRKSFTLPSGAKTLPFHYGDDKPAPRGTPVKAMHDGTVIYNRFDDGTIRIWPGLPKGYSIGGGYMVGLRNGPLTTWYFHHTALSPFKEGAKVKRGQTIGYVGLTGVTTGYHSHYETWVNGKHVAPSTLIGKSIAVSKPSTSKGDKVIHYARQDKDARAKGRVIQPKGHIYLNTSSGGPSNAANIVGGVGKYSITVHAYAKGQPGDAVDLVLVWIDTKNKNSQSQHYVERAVLDKSGTLNANVEFKRAVASGYRVFVKAVAPSSNTKPVTINLLDSDAYLFN